MEPEELIEQEPAAPEVENDPSELVDEADTTLAEDEAEDEEADEPLGEETAGEQEEEEQLDAEDQGKKRLTIFLSYNRNDNDLNVATRIYYELSQHHDVFLDYITIEPGKVFESETEDWLAKADFIIALISAESVKTLFMKAELLDAYKRYREFGRPSVIPVQIAYTGPYGLRLSAYIGHFQAIAWDNQDYKGLFEKLHAGIAHRPLPISKQVITGTDLIPIHEAVRTRQAETFVPPHEFATHTISFQEKRLLWLTGDVSVRNYVATSLAAQTAHNAERQLYEVTRARKWSDINKTYVSDSTIILRDALPNSHLGDSGEILEWYSLRAIIERNNIIIATAPEEEFERLEQELSRFQFTDFQRLEVGRNSYSDDDKRKIFQRLIEHMSGSGELDDKQFAWALELLKESDEGPSSVEKQPRARALQIRRREARARFRDNIHKWLPADIERFVGSLSQVRSEGDILGLLKRSAAIEDEIRAWFMDLDDSTRCFILALALFPDLSHDQLWEKYKTIVEHLRKFDRGLSLLTFGICRKRAQPNVSSDGPIYFMDERVADAIRQEVARSYREYFIELTPKLKDWSVPAGRNPTTPEQRNQRKAKVEETKETRAAIARMVGIAGRLNVEDLSEILDYWATDSNFHVRRTVALALEETAKSPAGRNHALNLLERWCLDLNSNGQLRWRAFAAAIALGHVTAAADDSLITIRAFQYLRSFARSHRKDARFYASIAIKQFARHVPLAATEGTLSRLAKDDRTEVRLNLAAALNEARSSSYNGQAAEELLERWIQSDDQNRRWVALCGIVTSRKSQNGTSADKYTRLLNYLDDEKTAGDLAAVLGETVTSDQYGAVSKDVFSHLVRGTKDEGWNNFAAGLGAVPLQKLEKELLPLLRFGETPPFDERAIDVRREVLRKKLDNPAQFVTTLKSWLKPEHARLEVFRALALLLEDTPDSSRAQFVTSMAAYFGQNPSGVNDLLATLEKLAPVYFESIAHEVRHEALRQLLQDPARFVTLTYDQLENPETSEATEESLELLAHNEPPGSREAMLEALLAGYAQIPKATRELLLVFRSSGSSNIANTIYEFNYRLIESSLSAAATFPALVLDMVQQDVETLALLNHIAASEPQGRRSTLVRTLVEARSLETAAADQLLALPALGEWTNLASLPAQVSRAFYMKKIFSKQFVTTLFTRKFTQNGA
jgi:hypothetical protein